MGKKKIKLCDGLVLDHHRALVDGACPKCGARLDWEAQFDADGTPYVAECCGLAFGLTPATVLVSVFESEKEDEE